VNRYLNATDAFVAAWLPGSEGAGVADVLLRKADGAVNYDFTGKLSFSWPETVMPVTFKNGDEPQGALFKRGYGLNYTTSQTITRVPEDPKAPADRHDVSVLYADKHVIAPWTINVQDDVAGVRMTTVTQTSPSGAFTATRSDKGVDANWSGTGRGEMRISGSGDDLQSLYKGKALQVRMLVNHKPEQPVFMGMRCALTFEESLAVKNGTMPRLADGGSNCKSSTPALYDITAQLKAAKANAPIVVTLPLSCFSKHGASLNNVAAPLAMVTKGKVSVTITDARITNSATTTCPAGFAETPVTKVQ
jgi:beta-glucosidase